MKIQFFSSSLLTLLFFLFISGDVTGQNSSFLPQNLGPNINTEYPELNPVLSEDGRTLYFNRQNHPDNAYGRSESQDIWYSYLQPDGTWSVAKRLEAPFNKSRSNAILCALGKETYLIDGTYTKGKNPKWYKRGVSVVTKNDNDQWSAPERIKVKAYHRLNGGLQNNVWMTSERKVMIFSFSRKNYGKANNLYVSMYRDGRWTKPKKISKIINLKTTSEEAPFVSADNETLYFTSNRTKDGKKDKVNYQIFKSTRLDETWTMWGAPVPLSDTVNSDQWESYFRTNKTASEALFASEKNSLGQADIFRIKLFEENPFVEIKGLVINRKTNAPLAFGRKFNILANGKQIDSIKINRDSSSYQIKLPLGTSYVLTPELKNFRSVADSVNVTNTREFTSIKKDLYLDPIPYVQVSGHLLVYQPRGVLPSSASPKIVINGVVQDTVRISYPEGSFEVFLPYGKAYTLSASARKFIGDEVKLDFTKVIEYQEVKKDLFVRANPVATVTGVFYVKGTTQKISGKYNPKLTINGEIVDSAQIDTANASYKIILPLNKSYTLAYTSTKYKGLPEVVNLTETTEPADITLHLYGTYVSNLAQITGKVINRKTNKPLLNAEDVKIQSNGQEIAGSSYNKTTGEYQAEISTGSSNTLNAYLPKYFPQYEIIDLTKEKASVKVLKDLYVTPLEVGQSVKLNNIFFESAKSTLKPKSFPELDKVARFLAENESVKIQIEGHTDNVGKADVNMKLSRWRARAVQQYLVKKGVDVSRVKFDGFGSGKPIAKNTTAQGRSLNRRVEFKILSLD